MYSLAMYLFALNHCDVTVAFGCSIIESNLYVQMLSIRKCVNVLKIAGQEINEFLMHLV